MQTDSFVLSLVEHVGSGHLSVWGILHEEMPGHYKVAVRSKDRQALMTIEETLSKNDAQLAVEKQIFDIGVIIEGDEIIDLTNP